MNAAERCTRLARLLTAHPELHSQASFTSLAPTNECGTVGCVGGWAGLWQAGVLDIDPDGNLVYDRSTLRRAAEGPTMTDEVRAWLGLSDAAAQLLFYDTLDYASSYVARGPERLAVAVLERLGDGRLSGDFTRQDLNAVATGIGLVSVWRPTCGH